MITIYKHGQIPKSIEIVKLNDVYFNKYTAQMLDNRANAIIEKIDHAELTGPYTIKSRFDETTLNTDKLSSGCKTVLNIMYNPDKVFDIRECGDNALDMIYSLDEGKICCDYPLISFDMTRVNVYDKSKKKCREIDDYEELKEWWSGED